MKNVLVVLLAVFLLPATSVAGNKKDACSSQVNSYVKAMKSASTSKSVSSEKRKKAKKEVRRVKRLRAQNKTDCEVAEEIPTIKRTKQALKLVEKLFGDKEGKSTN